MNFKLYFLITVTSFVYSSANAIEECAMKPGFQPELNCHNSKGQSDCSAASHTMRIATQNAYMCEWANAGAVLGLYRPYCAVLPTQMNPWGTCINLTLEDCEKFEYCAIVSQK